jgi:hypothetical protein
MKVPQIISLFFLLSLLVVADLDAQDYFAMLQNKSYKTFEAHLASTVQIEKRRSKQEVSKARAIEIVKKTMSELNPVKWEFVHKGVSEAQKDNYIVMKAFNAEGDGLRIFLYVHKAGDKREITAIRFRSTL